MYKILQTLLVLFAPSAFGLSVKPLQACRNIPGGVGWPSGSTWAALDQQVNGRLIKTSPIAESCYPGSGQNLADCDFVSTQWAIEDFQTSHAIGRVLPYNISCPPVNHTAGEAPTSCALGINPVYAVNATTVAEINATVQFARRNNIRLVTTGTGHDLLGRSDGFGALQVWLRHYRNAIVFQERYTSATGCEDPRWNGSAIYIDGVYQWRDVAVVARANNVFVATGGTPSVGAIGGWSQGGGHGPATNAVGWGVDQILEARVLLADGRIVIANSCQNSDLYRALRGGGPGYGLVLAMAVKAHPNVDVITAHHLNIAPLTVPAYNGGENSSSTSSPLSGAISAILQRVPNLVDGGVGGYAFWYNDYPSPVVLNSTSGYTHGVWTIGQNESSARALLDPVVDLLRAQAFSSALRIESNYVTYRDYWTFYDTEMGLDAPESQTTIMYSRAIYPNHVSSDSKVRGLVDFISSPQVVAEGRGGSGGSNPQQYGSNAVLFVGGDRVKAEGQDPFTGFNPAWRRAAFGLVKVRVVPLNSSFEERAGIEEDVLAKGAALDAFAPDTGSYMNEADRRDPNYIRNFYGDYYASHLATKEKYDPENWYFCPTCVGSESYEERQSDGALCKKDNDRRR